MPVFPGCQTVVAGRAVVFDCEFMISNTSAYHRFVSLQNTSSLNILPQSKSAQPKMVFYFNGKDAVVTLRWW